jgi:DNA modification methylase
LRTEEKQIPLIMELIDRLFYLNLLFRYSKIGNLVFDPFLGTGTTIDAAIQLHRFGVGCEIDEECCNAISERLWNTAERMVQNSNY